MGFLRLDYIPFGLFFGLVLFLVEPVDPSFGKHALPVSFGKEALFVRKSILIFREKRSMMPVLKTHSQGTCNTFDLERLQAWFKTDIQYNQGMHMSAHISIRLLQAIVRSFLSRGGIET